MTAILEIIIHYSINLFGSLKLMCILLITAYQITNDGFAPKYIEEAGGLSLGQYINRDRCR